MHIHRKSRNFWLLKSFCDIGLLLPPRLAEMISTSRVVRVLALNSVNRHRLIPWPWSETEREHRSTCKYVLVSVSTGYVLANQDVSTPRFCFSRVANSIRTSTSTVSCNSNCQTCFAVWICTYTVMSGLLHELLVSPSFLGGSFCSLITMRPAIVTLRPAPMI